MLMKSEHRKELVSEIRSLAQSQGLNTVFTTFLEITANSLAAQTDPENAEKRERRYQEIPMVGRHAGRDLDRYFGGSWEAFESAIQSGFDFTQLPNFGETMHNNIYKWYADEEEAKLWRPLLDKIIFEKETTNMSTDTTNPFYGKTVVATGKLENYTRDGIQMRLLELGAKPSSSVSKNTDYLIVGEKAGSKLAKAQQLGVKTLTEQEFENMLAE